MEKLDCSAFSVNSLAAIQSDSLDYSSTASSVRFLRHLSEIKVLESSEKGLSVRYWHYLQYRLHI